MRLDVKEAAQILDVSEKTIYRWISQNKIPVYRVNEQYRFSRAELLEWATRQKMKVSPDIFLEPEHTEIIKFEDALREGGIHYRVEGNTKAEVLKSAVQVMPLPEEVDRGFLLQVLLARESLGSTGIGGGIAIPHVRNPIVLHVSKPLVALCFLEHPVDFQAIDGNLVDVLFMIVSPTIKAHLGLLSRLTYGLRQPQFGDAVDSSNLRETIYQAAKWLDERMALYGAGAAATSTQGQ